MEEHFEAADHHALDVQAEADRGVQASSSCDEILDFFKRHVKMRFAMEINEIVHDFDVFTVD